MKIEAVNSYKYNQNKKIKFKAHPDYKKLAASYDILASSYFRRGRFYGSPSDDFVNVIYCLKDIFFQKQNSIRKMLIAGIGESQESFSMLAVIKCLLKKEPLNKNLDLHIVDLQSKPKDKILFKQSFLDDIYPRYMGSSFVKDEGEKYGYPYWMHYRVNDEIFDFLKNTYNNPKNSHWNSRIQEVIKDIPDETFDIVSINNTLGYIKGGDVICETIKNVIRTMKKNGVFITDPISNFNRTCEGKTYEIYPGIFKKLSY